MTSVYCIYHICSFKSYKESHYTTSLFTKEEIAPQLHRQWPEVHIIFKNGPQILMFSSQDNSPPLLTYCFLVPHYLLCWKFFLLMPSMLYFPSQLDKTEGDEPPRKRASKRLPLVTTKTPTKINGSKSTFLIYQSVQSTGSNIHFSIWLKILFTTHFLSPVQQEVCLCL